jgi:hypothetical protein
VLDDDDAAHPMVFDPAAADGDGLSVPGYQAFKRAHVATWPQDTAWRITACEIRTWLGMPGNPLTGIDPAAHDPIGLWFTTRAWPERAPGRFSVVYHGRPEAAELWCRTPSGGEGESGGGLSIHSPTPRAADGPMPDRHSRPSSMSRSSTAPKGKSAPPRCVRAATRSPRWPGARSPGSNASNHCPPCSETVCCASVPSLAGAPGGCPSPRGATAPAPLGKRRMPMPPASPPCSTSWSC